MLHIVIVGGDPPLHQQVHGWLLRARGGRRIASVDSVARPRDVPEGTNLVVGLVDARERAGADLRRVGAVATPAHQLVVVLFRPTPHVLEPVCGLGADAIVSASEAGVELALREISRDRRWIDPSLSPLIIEHLANRQRAREAFGLTIQEHRVASRLPRGLTYREIARELGIGEETVKTYVRNVLRKLGADDRVAAASIVVREGIS